MFGNSFSNLLKKAGYALVIAVGGTFLINYFGNDGTGDTNGEEQSIGKKVGWLAVDLVSKVTGGETEGKQNEVQMVNPITEEPTDEETPVEESPIKSSQDGTPLQTAIIAGSDGGKWEAMPSGETVYQYGDDNHASNTWIKDGKKVYYVDALGCRMLNNYAHDGYYAGADGSWDSSKERITSNETPHNSVKYTNDTSRYWVFSISNNNGNLRGTAKLCSTSYNQTEVFKVKYTGHSTFLLSSPDDEYSQWNMAVLDGGRTIRLSIAGQTEVYRAPQ